MIYVLVFVAFVADDLRYYQVGGTFANSVDCNKEKAKASALLTKTGTGLFCLEVNRT